MIIAEGNKQGRFDEDERKLLYNALKFDDIKVKNIMIPKEKITFISMDSPEEKILETIRKCKYTRFPVYYKTKDNIVGVLNIKDILLNTENTNINLKQMLRKPIYVSGEEKLDNIFKVMQLNNNHIAIVKDENGHAEGMITMEDIIEKLMGDILDEFDKK